MRDISRTCSRSLPFRRILPAVACMALFLGQPAIAEAAQLFPPSNSCTNGGAEFLSWDGTDQISCSTGQQVIANATAATGGCSANQAVTYLNSGAENGTGVDNNHSTYNGSNQYQCTTQTYYSYSLPAVSATSNCNGQAGEGCAQVSQSCQPYEVLVGASASCSSGATMYSNPSSRSTMSATCVEANYCSSQAGGYWTGTVNGECAFGLHWYSGWYTSCNGSNTQSTLLSLCQANGGWNAIVTSSNCSYVNSYCTGYSAVPVTATISAATCEGLTWQH